MPVNRAIYGSDVQQIEHVNDIIAASPSRYNVQVAIDSAQPGETVVIPSGTATWDRHVVVDKAVNIRGSGVGNTIITNYGFGFYDGLDNFEIQGIEWHNDGSVPYQPSIEVGYWSIDSTDGSRDIKIHDCRWFGYNNPVKIVGHCTGVMYDCELYGNATDDGNNDGIFVWGENEVAWTKTTRLGSDDFFFIEDCTWDAQGDYMGHFAMCGRGGRMVFRHNTIKDGDDGAWAGAVDIHGSGHGIDCLASRAFEVYGNTFERGGTRWARAMFVRAATGVIYDNVFDDSLGNWDSYIEMTEYRYEMIGGVSPDFATTIPITVDSQWCPISEGGEGYPCVGQIGRGYEHNLEPLYIWDNVDQNGAPVASNIRAGATDVILEGRDYYEETELSGYAPYTYPHPLRS